MKRADQHSVTVTSPLSENTIDDVMQPDDSGIDMPSEKDIPVQGQQQAPSMGALPIDTLGSTRPAGDWQSDALEETHTSPSSENDADTDTGTVAVGNGPDPEHSDF